MTLEARGVTVRFGRRSALTEADLASGNHEVVGLIGPNGSGKTTLLRTLYRGLQPEAGQVLLDDRKVDGLRARELAQRIAVVVQEPPTEITLTVAQMVMLGRSPYRSAWEPYTSDDHRIAAELLTRVALRERADDPYETLSGGERQRVLLARALAQGADHLLLDEPTNHLDVRYQHEILALVRTLPASVVVVLHDLNLAARYCDRLILIHQGAVVATGSSSAVLDPTLIEQVYGVPARRVDAPDGIPQLVFGGAEPAEVARSTTIRVDDVDTASAVFQQLFGYHVSGQQESTRTLRNAHGDTITFEQTVGHGGLRYLGIDCTEPGAPLQLLSPPTSQP